MASFKSIVSGIVLFVILVIHAARGGDGKLPTGMEWTPFDDSLKQSRTFNMLGGSLGSFPFPKPKLYNTSIALTASFFTYYLPTMPNNPQEVAELVNQVSCALTNFLNYLWYSLVP